ncbi:copper resistance CopC family protein [Cryobacterium zhongshanensis]|uniref:Copper resistance protein CopC n=1 Tax=Cryobacterium zhongshanensis TaxID=2928153 RepID=A0AA41QYW6_9MICO|nr:copper resistance CopC family protein [Cryobacterium zhongshanensis]MCI4658471.1 copper resistance protein CopC [Cryobacterium zhongshanensis]
MLATTAPASAHDALISSDPRPGATITTPLERVELTFSNALLELGGIDNVFVIQVSDDAGRFYGSGCVDLSNDTVSTALMLGEPGTYTVRWQVTSGDGHPISDSYTFAYAPPLGTKAIAGQTTAPVCGGEGSLKPPSTEATATSAEASVDQGLATGLIVGVSVLVAIAGTLLVIARRTTPRKRDHVHSD